MGDGMNILLIMLVVLLIVFGVYLLTVPGAIALNRGHKNAEAVRVLGWCGFFLPVLWLAAMVWAYTGERQAKAQPVKNVVGPGRFRLYGVDRDSGMDTDLVVEAASEENAKAKGEIKGMVVTRVARLKESYWESQPS